MRDFLNRKGAAVMVERGRSVTALLPLSFNVKERFYIKLKPRWEVECHPPAEHMPLECMLKLPGASVLCPSPPPHT